MIEVHNSRIAKLLGYSITLFPFILYDGVPSDVTRRHEFIHVEQIKRVGLVRFYVSYLFYYLRGRVKGLGHYDAYMAIPWEVEAYRRQNETYTGI